MTGSAAQNHGSGRPCPQWADALVEHSLVANSHPPVELERHLAECERCAEYLRWLLPASDVLAEAVPGRTPPRALKQRVMGEVRAGSATSVRARIRALAGRPQYALSVVAAGAVVAVGVAVAVDGDDGSPQAVPVVASSAVDGRLVVEGSAGRLELTGLPRLHRDRVFQAWIRTGGRLDPSTTFRADASSSAVASIGNGLDRADEVLVTSEPVGGSEAPSRRPILRVPLS